MQSDDSSDAPLLREFSLDSASDAAASYERFPAVVPNHPPRNLISSTREPLFSEYPTAALSSLGFYDVFLLMMSP